MHCIVLSAPRGRETWELRRSIEVLGYHREKEEVRILFLLYAENKCLAGEDNYLSMMHRGNIECSWIPAWPLPLHADEEAMLGQESAVSHNSLLARIYGPAFRDCGSGKGHLIQEQALTPWDSWDPIADRLVRAWEPLQKIKPEFEVPPLDQYIPFTTWKIGPFKEKGSFLITFALRFKGETYRRLVSQEPEFTVDGPLRLLLRARFEDLAFLDKEQQSLWIERLATFETQSVFSQEGYDVIVLDRPFADKVNTFALSGMTRAPLQLDPQWQSFGSRFITVNQDFRMSAQYVSEAVATAEAELVQR